MAKLIDILARELKVWPEVTNVVGQASDGSLHLCRADEDFNGWTDEKYTMADDWSSAHVTREQWQAAVEALKEPAWNGEGLPPVGTVCQVTEGNKHVFLTQFNGKQVRILAHDVCEDVSVAVFRVLGQTEETQADYHALVASCFEPIKTAEQIAAEEREKAIEELRANAPGIAWKSAAAIYDAGYRKQ